MKPTVDFDLNIKWTTDGHLLIQISENEQLEGVGVQTVKDILEELQKIMIKKYC